VGKGAVDRVAVLCSNQLKFLAGFGRIDSLEHQFSVVMAQRVSGGDVARLLGDNN